MWSTKHNLEKVGYTPTGTHLWTGIRWAWRTLGMGTGVLGKMVGKATYFQQQRARPSVNNSTRLITSG